MKLVPSLPGRCEGATPLLFNPLGENQAAAMDPCRMQSRLSQLLSMCACFSLFSITPIPSARHMQSPPTTVLLWLPACM